MLDNKVMEMTPGEALLEAPIGELIQRIAKSIAEAQLQLDQVGVRVATLLNETKVTFNKSDGGTVQKSLLEMGFLPPFYTFTETEIEVKMTITLKVEEDLSIEGEVEAAEGEGVTAAKRVVPFGASISAEYHRKYEFDMTGASSVKTRLVSVPPPSVFLQTIQEHARASSKLLQSTSTSGTTDTGTATSGTTDAGTTTSGTTGPGTTGPGTTGPGTTGPGTTDTDTTSSGTTTDPGAGG